jgi:hypothetical protein
MERSGDPIIYYYKYLLLDLITFPRYMLLVLIAGIGVYKKYQVKRTLFDFRFLRNYFGQVFRIK